MKFSLHLIGRYVDLSGVDLASVVDRVTRSVAEVDSMTVHGEGLESVRVARILEISPRQDGGSVVCTVDVGGTLETVVCGAPNARAGLVTAYAPPGTVVGGRTIEVRNVRGVASRGMLCSPSEIALTEDRAGICELPDDVAPGTPLSQTVPIVDTVFDVDNKSLTHRPDLWGHVGMAREIAAMLKRPLVLPAGVPLEGAKEAPLIDVHVPERCMRYTAVRFSVPAVAPSPLWLQTLLHRLGIRPISNVVDLTNFVMVEWGQPVHAFDARQISGGHIIVRLARPGERVETLDGVPRELTADDMVIADPEKPLAIAGVMGLANSEISSDTTECVLEVATFRAEVVRRTAARLRMRTEASVRYEKSLDPEMPSTVCSRFGELLRTIVPGSRIMSGMRDAYAAQPSPPVIHTSVGYINERLGATVSPQRITEGLTALGFSVTSGGDGSLTVHVPSYRATKDISIADDIVEEVGRTFGYENIEPVHPRTLLPTPHRDATLVFHWTVRTALSFTAGLHEVQNYSFDPEPLVRRLGIVDPDRVALSNPIGADATHLRHRLLGGMLSVLQRNRLAAERLGLYEIGRAFSRANDGLPNQPYHLAVLVWSRPPHADYADAQRAAVADIKRVIADLELRTGIQLGFAPLTDPPAWLHPARAASVQDADGTAIGSIGALHPRVCDLLEVGPFAAYAELDLDRLQVARRDARVYQPPSRFPALPVDISLVVPYAVTHHAIVTTIDRAKPPLLQLVEYIGTFVGEPIPDGQKSVTYRLVFQANDRTLTKTDVAAWLDAIVAACRVDHGATLRA